jgi:cupin superfamily acireductone dioxygenase involved in methionine salvage
MQLTYFVNRLNAYITNDHKYASSIIENIDWSNMILHGDAVIACIQSFNPLIKNILKKKGKKLSDFVNLHRNQDFFNFTIKIYDLSFNDYKKKIFELRQTLENEIY